MKRSPKLERQARLKRIHKLIVEGLTTREIGRRLGVSGRTIRRDIESDYESLHQAGESELATNRIALIGELGRVYTETVKDCKRARANDKETCGYLVCRVKALQAMARIMGAEMPAKLLIKGQIRHTIEPSVQMIPEAELLKMAQFAAEVAGQTPAFRPGGFESAGNGNGSGNGQN